MKIVLVGLIMLCLLTLAYAGTVNTNPDQNAKSATQQSGQAMDAKVSTPAPAHSSQHAAIISKTEADSLQIQGNNQLSESDVGEVKVGDMGSGDVLYILLIVLVVVVIVALVR